MKKKIIALLLIITMCCLFGINSHALSYEEIENYFRAGVVISSYCGPVYPLCSLLSKLDKCGIKGVPTLKEQREKYDDIADDSLRSCCSYLSVIELKSIIQSVFSDELADHYLSGMFELKNRAGEPVYKEINGLIYDFGDYGDPGGIRTEEITVDDISAVEYRIHVKYRYGWDLEEDRVIPVLEDDLVLSKINGAWKFTSFVSLNDMAYLSVYPDQISIYPKNWVNPKTSDSAVYITAAAGVIALCCAVICKKKIKER